MKEAEAEKEMKRKKKWNLQLQRPLNCTFFGRTLLLLPPPLPSPSSSLSSSPLSVYTHLLLLLFHLNRWCHSKMVRFSKWSKLFMDQRNYYGEYRERKKRKTREINKKKEKNLVNENWENKLRIANDLMRKSLGYYAMNARQWIRQFIIHHYAELIERNFKMRNSLNSR